METALSDLDAGDTLTAAEGALKLKRRAEADILRLAVHWADLHPGPPESRVGPHLHDERQIQIGGEGTPVVGEFAPAELAVSLEMHSLSGRHLMSDAMDLYFRLPRLWARVVDELRIERWVACKVASMTHHLGKRQAAEIDRRLAEEAADLPPSRLLNLVEAMVVAADNEAADKDRDDALAERFVNISDHQSRPGTSGVYGCIDAESAHRLDATLDKLAEALAKAGDEDTKDVRRARALALLGSNPVLALKLQLGVDPDCVDDDLADVLRKHPEKALAPRAQLNLHVTDFSLFGDPDLGTSGAADGGCGVARSPELGPLTLRRLLEILDHSQVTLRPVLDPEGVRPADTYEFTGDLRDAVHIITPADCFPYAAGTNSTDFDVDHTEAYDPDGPPGQTRVGNGGPMVRHHHRIKTHGTFSVRQPRPGVYVWRTRHRRYRVTDGSGTHVIGEALGDAIFDGSPMEEHLATLGILHERRRVTLHAA
jgi:hypothetical protein